jgi:hypothetical protein
MHHSHLAQVKHRLSRSALNELSSMFDSVLHLELLIAGSFAPVRKRIFTPAVTFWAFLHQVLAPKSSCSHVLQKVQTLLAVNRKRFISSNTSAYCQARQRLPLALLSKLHQQTVLTLQKLTRTSDLWCGRRVRVVDCTSVSLPDTKANQSEFPQPGRQKPGCGFPSLKIGALFCLASGALLHYTISPLAIHDGRLLRRLWNFLKSGDVLIGDRAFCSYASIAHLLDRGIDVVFRAHQKRPNDLRRGKKLGPRDRLITWSRPVQAHFPMTLRELHSLPRD